MATAFMFKGPAALTGASTVSTSGTIGAGAITGTSLATSSNGDITVNGSGTVTLGTGGFTLDGATITTIQGADGEANDTLVTKDYADATYLGGGGGVTIVTVTNGDSAINLTAVTGNVVYVLENGVQNGGVLTQTSMTNLGNIADGTIVRFVVKTITNTINVGVAGGTPFRLVGSSVGSFTFGTVGQGLSFVAASGELYLLGGGFGA